MVVLQGRVKQGVGHFRIRMTNYPNVFTKATGEYLIPGTVNVDVGQQVPIKEDFRILGMEINEPTQDLIFERCAINGIPAYRIRPFNPSDGSGGHGDNVLEIACSQRIPGVSEGAEVEVRLFREDIKPVAK